MSILSEFSGNLPSTLSGATNIQTTKDANGKCETITILDAPHNRSIYFDFNRVALVQATYENGRLASLDEFNKEGRVFAMVTSRSNGDLVYIVGDEDLRVFTKRSDAVYQQEAMVYEELIDAARFVQSANGFSFGCTL